MGRLHKDVGVFDYVVVGAGSAGCAIASRLSEDQDVSVLLLEAGGRDWNPWIHIPVGYFKTMHNPSTDWCYLTDRDEGIDNRQLQWPRGKVLGGSSSLNGLLYIRGQKEDYNDWASLGNEGWSYDDVLPYFKMSECQSRGKDKYHGVDGPLKVSDLRLKRDIAERFVEAAQEVGIPWNDDFNGENQEGVGYFQQTAFNGLRCSSAKAFLTSARKRHNLTILTHAHTSKLDIVDKTAKGVEFFCNGKAMYVSAAKEIIVSAGAIGSPQILQLSGVGNRAELEAVGVDCVHHLPGVGENLQDHLQIRLVYKTSCTTLNDELRTPLHKLTVGVKYALFRKGPLTLAASQVCIFTQSSSDLTRPDIQFHMQPLSADKPGEGVHPFSAFTTSVCQLRPESRGRVKITSKDYSVHPSIQPNYLSHPKDKAVAINAIKVAREITDASPLSSVISEEFVPGSKYQTDEQLLEAATKYSQSIYHPVGTCKMGNDAMAVVDNELKVHGLKSLRVADASIMPIIVSGNTNAPSIMIGEKCAAMIKKETSLSKSKSAKLCEEAI
ncbi:MULTISPECIES: GMC family oxidoreductase [unclassified Vibrio]|uniref:GMC family oxidoreductase n=1 Tax=unclassified Vibrio TaxID=2614977 RepID=UPI00354E9EB2